MAPPSKEATTARQGHSILIAWNSAIIENTQDNISKSSVFIDADVLGCINMRHQTTFNALYSAPDEPCGCRNSHMHINEIFVSNDPGHQVPWPAWSSLASPAPPYSMPSISRTSTSSA